MADLAAVSERPVLPTECGRSCSLPELRVSNVQADLPELVEEVLRRMESRYGRRLELSEEAVETVRAYAWPGNLRELEAAVERACSMSSGPVVHLRDLPTQLQEFRGQREAEQDAKGGARDGEDAGAGDRADCVAGGDGAEVDCC